MSFYRLIEGDSRQVLRNMKKGSVDCIITDPPYGLGFDYGDDYKDTKSNLKKLIKCSLPDMRRVAKRVAVMCGPTQIWEYPKPRFREVFVTRLRRYV